jgi:hypothetical protein
MKVHEARIVPGFVIERARPGEAKGAKTHEIKMRYKTSAIQQ